MISEDYEYDNYNAYDDDHSYGSLAREHQMDSGMPYDANAVFDEHPLAEVYDNWYVDGYGMVHYFDDTVDCGDGDY